MPQKIQQKIVEVGSIKIANHLPLVLIAGPCVIEDEKSALNAADRLRKITDDLGMGLIYKSSYDKANRSSNKSFRGVGVKRGLGILKKVRQKFGLPVISDVHSEMEVPAASEVLDVIQIPAFLCRQTDLLEAAARTGRPVNVKKGQFMAPWDMARVVEKVNSAGNGGVLVTERGTSFGYNNLVSDFRGVKIISEMGVPVIFDATHSVQLPGAKGDSSGGERKFVSTLSRAASAVGVAGIFLEVHPDPDKAPCDGPTMLRMKNLPKLLADLQAIDRISKGLS
ncbi:MAG: 3-deoxy-8-phosphooctulonate synthase [Nitrospinota bacterium]